MDKKLTCQILDCTYEDKKHSGRPVKLSERSRRLIRSMSLRNRTMSVRSITSSFNIQRTEHISSDTVSKILIKYGLRSYRPARKPFITLKQRRRRIECARCKRHWNDNKGAKWFSAMSPCFKVLGNVLAIELDGLSMRDIVKFALGRLLGMVRKFMYGMLLTECLRNSETDTK